MRRVIALGFFDGVHLGHQALLRRTVDRAGELGAVAAACTFDQRPARLLEPEAPAAGDLTTRSRRVRLMEEQGVEVITAPFDEAVMQTPWDEYVTGYLVERLGACHLVCGENHRFGHKGQGTADKLKELCAALGLGCDIIPPVKVDGQSVSSTRVRQLVREGRMEEARAMLGRPFALEGRVVHGKGLGHTLGFPTVNLEPERGLVLPERGVYAAQVRLEKGQVCRAVTNIGVRPTVDDSGRVSVESFLLDFDGDLYGRELTLELFGRLRSEKRFDSLEALREAVSRDAERAEAYFQD